MEVVGDDGTNLEDIDKSSGAESEVPSAVPKGVLQCCTARLGVSLSWIVPGSRIASDATQTRPEPGSMLPTLNLLLID